jgi:hypothetical protein
MGGGRLRAGAAVGVEAGDGGRDAQLVPIGECGDHVGGDAGVGRVRADLVEQQCVLLGDEAGFDAELHAPRVPHQHLGLIQRD